MTHPHPKRSFVPQAVLTRSGKLSTAGVAVNTVRPVNTANTKAVNTVRPVNTANTKEVNTVRSVNTDASKPIGNPQQQEYKEKGVIDSGFSRHMTGNKCYLDEYEDYDGGFVSFGDGKGRISGKETLNIRFLENSPNVKGNGPDWLFDVDSLSISMNYVPVVAGNKTNGIAGTKDNTVAGQADW
ncbi:hypothetical protein Tco_0138156 [Tanacetum coccineum]